MFIYLFIIFIDDKIIEEQVRKVMSFKLIFCKNYNLFIYSKSVITIIFEKIIEKEGDFSESNNFNNENDLFDIKNELFKKDFH